MTPIKEAKGFGAGRASALFDQSGTSSDMKRLSLRGGKPPDPPPPDLTFMQAAADPLHVVLLK
eukprot:2091268-Amphidinium_carterae.4